MGGVQLQRSSSGGGLTRTHTPKHTHPVLLNTRHACFPPCTLPPLRPSPPPPPPPLPQTVQEIEAIIEESRKAHGVPMGANVETDEYIDDAMVGAGGVGVGN